MSSNQHRQKAFTLLELIAVVVIIMVLMAGIAVNFANSRPGVQVKTDASNMIAFLRNMWDYTKASGTPLVLFL